MARTVASESPEIKAMKSIERHLVKADADLSALAPTMREWVESYLRQKYGWFVKAKAS
jgi:hypothetical protein